MMRFASATNASRGFSLGWYDLSGLNGLPQVTTKGLYPWFVQCVV
jgi:hypothetical protein